MINKANLSDNNIEIENNQDLIEFQEHLKRIDTLSNNAMDILNSFDSKILSLESTIRPIHQSTKDLMLLDSNVSKTLQSLGKIVQHLNTATVEEQVIMAGPTEGKVLEFIESLKKLTSANSYLGTTELATEASKKTKNQLLKASTQHLINYTTTLVRKLELESKTNFETIEEVIDYTTEKNIDQTTAKELKTINIYLVESLKQQKIREEELLQFREIIVSLRTSHLTNCLRFVERFIQKSQSNKNEITEGMLKFTMAILEIVENETNVITSVFGIQNQSTEMLRQIVMPVYASFEKIYSELLKKTNVQRNIGVVLEFHRVLSSQFEAMESVFKKIGIPTASLASLLARTQSSLITFFEEFYYAIKNSSNNPKDLSSDGTVQETIAEFMNTVIELNKYEEMVEPLLSGLASERCMDRTNTAPNSSLFCCYLSNLVVEINTNSKTQADKYKKPELKAVSNINNSYYIIKTLRNKNILTNPAKISDIVKQKLIAQMKLAENEYYQLWINCFSPLTDTKLNSILTKDHTLTSSEKNTIKDSLKEFNNKFEDFCRLQKEFTISDLELRAQLITYLESVLLSIYNNCQKKYQNSGFAKSPSKYFRFDSDLLSKAIKYAID